MIFPPSKVRVIYNILNMCQGAEMSKSYRKEIVVRIGKKGITEGLVEEIKRNLEKHKIVKIKLLKSYRETIEKSRQELADMIAKLVNAKVIEIRGYTLTLERG